MKIKNLSFITPLLDDENYVLEPNYSGEFKLKDGECINWASDVGPRDNQQDSMSMVENNGYLMLLVADGMGGLEDGEKASYVIAEIFKTWFENLTKEQLNMLSEDYIKRLYTRIIRLAKERLIPKDAGTTLNMSIIGPTTTMIINIGDSRSYSIKDGSITLETYDDSLSFRYFDGSTSENRDLLRFYENNNIITNSISRSSYSEVFIKTIKNSDYDILFHITDGISDILTEEEIKKISMNENPACNLVKAAVNSRTRYNNKPKDYMPEFNSFINPHDNASVVIFTKKRVK